MAHPDSLSGRALNQRARKNTYLQIDRYIATHPEFEQIKDAAKSKVLARVNRFRERQASNAQSPMDVIPDVSFDNAQTPGRYSQLSSPNNLAQTEQKGSKLSN